ncbi:MAG: FAD-binding oxidoreductase [Candidatus Taylorbacteria bacterium]
MPKFLNNFLNTTTMYRLILYVVGMILVAALVLCSFGLLPYNPLALLYSTAILVVVSWITNQLFVRVFKTHANIESVFVTALILALIISPPHAGEYISILPFLIWTGIWSMAAKFIIAINKKHVFNPVAFAVALTAITLNQSATWWVGTLYMLPFVLIGGLLIVKKIRRFDMVIVFLVSALVSIFATSSAQLGLADILTTLHRIFIDSPMIFFAFIMLTEPLTSPLTRTKRMVFALVIGLLFTPTLHVLSIYSTPELALLTGNLLAFFMSPMRKYVLTLTKSDLVAKDTGEFTFTSDHPIKFKPGQYMEWTLGHDDTDSRGNRRFFTIASSPTEPEVKLGVKFYPESSSFKTSFAKLEIGQTIVAGGVAGDFVLPHNKSTKLVFIAGGIGITPFRSMIKYLIDKNEKRDIVVLYSNNTIVDLAYPEIWQAATEKLGIKVVCTLTDTQNLTRDWSGRIGFVSPDMITHEVPDYMNRTYYISGPHGMVSACEEMLHKMHIPGRRIRTDFFPGF